MSRTNPYDSYLDGRPIEAILSSTPAALVEVLTKLGEKQVAMAPGPGKWSAAEVACHLADCELVFGFRLRQAQAEDSPVIQPFDQDKWAATYSGVSASRAADVFAALRGWNLVLIQNASPEARARKTTHPERGEMTFQTIIETMAGHDLNHLIQLSKVAEALAV